MSLSLRSASVLLAIAVMTQPAAAAGFFGPSTDLLKGDALSAKLRAQPVVLSISGGVLDVRTKSAAVGSFLVGFVVSSALASGGGGASSAQQMQQNMQANMKIATSFHQNFQVAMTQMASDQATKPTVQIAKEGPIVTVSQKLIASLLQEPDIKLSLASAAQPALPTNLQLLVSQPEWKLDYSMVSSEYTLRYQVDASLYQKESDTVFFKESCKGEASKKLALEDWELNDYSEVALAAADISTLCTQSLVAALQLTPAAAVKLAAGDTGSVKPSREASAVAPTVLATNPSGEASVPAPTPDIAKAP